MEDVIEPQGMFLGMPYDFRKPTIEKVRQRFWCSEDDRVFTPMVFGWGYSINLYQVASTVGLV
jgi:hypothetical protein